MDVTTNACLSLSIGIGAAIGWIRYRTIDSAFRPFLLLVSAGLVHEIASILLLWNGYSNALPFNLFLLCEALLLNWQFHRWGLWSTDRQFHIVQAGLAGWWLTELALLPDHMHFPSYFIIGYSTAIVLGSIQAINRLLFRNDNVPLLRNPIFVLCVSFVLFFSFSALVETYWLFGLQRSKTFRNRIHQLLCYVNLITNCLFALAILWMPMKHRSIPRF